eukprot:TRINITY_DN7200_c0_g1_i11.p1 TRINITY_DN7200_c0_g1~~TRINITY_DN7200_c0_g1_i11.p1  ORF type:complete len:264 (-),score=57.87 TRINITY_DN7200_c0_g1_i11:174-965(-)
MIRRPPRSTLSSSSAASDVYKRQMVQLVHISDTHNVAYPDTPPGDILVHTGDFTNGGTRDEVEEFVAWFGALPHRHKIVICGNHEKGFDQRSLEENAAMLNRSGAGIHYLQDSGVELEGIRFFGSSYSNCGHAFFFPDNHGGLGLWEGVIPSTGVDVLLTHSPPRGIMDLAWEGRGAGCRGPCKLCGKSHERYDHWGSAGLLQFVNQSPEVRVHCFGHVHDQVGQLEGEHTVFSNAAMDIARQPSVIHLWTCLLYTSPSPRDS